VFTVNTQAKKHAGPHPRHEQHTYSCARVVPCWATSSARKTAGERRGSAGAAEGGEHAPSLVTKPVGALVLTAAATDRRLVPARRMLTWDSNATAPTPPAG
jgi:hypothetical protein